MRRLRYFLRGRLFPCALFLLLIAAAGVVLAIELPRLLAPAALMERALSFAAAIVVVAIRDLPEQKIAKLILLCFLPWMGFILVLLFTEEEPLAPPPEGGSGGTLFRRVSNLAEHFCGTHARNGRVEYFASGEEMRPALLADLRRAEHRIYLEYYIIAQGNFWGEILSVLEEKAREGVDVRVIFDDFGCSLTLPRGYKKELERHMIQTRVFRRLKPRRGLTRRDHRKIFLIDDICYTGGLNLADEYVGECIRFGYWKDSAVRIQGDMTSFEDLFLRTWYALNGSEREKRPPAQVVESKAESGKFSVVADGTEGGGRAGEKLFSLLFASAESSIVLSSPYLSLPHGMMQLLGAAAASGVRVRLLIPHIPDKKLIFFLTRAYARELVRMGVEVREYTPGFMHAKSLVIDKRAALVSSYNLDFRSLYVQAECGVFFEDEGAISALEKDLSACFEQSEGVKKANAFVQVLGRLLMLFAPLT